MPGTMGSMRALHSGETLKPSRPHPIVSMRQRRAVENATSELIYDGAQGTMSRGQRARGGQSEGGTKDFGTPKPDEKSSHLVVVHVVGNVLNDLVRFRSDLPARDRNRVSVESEGPNCRSEVRRGGERRLGQGGSEKGTSYSRSIHPCRESCERRPSGSRGERSSERGKSAREASWTKPSKPCGDATRDWCRRNGERQSR